MRVRDAVESDAEALASLADGPLDVVRNLVHDRTVRVAERDEDVVAFVSFDARPGTVYVTQLGGEPRALERLLEEPVRFARREDMEVELLVAETDEAIRETAVDVGFDRDGDGPRFADIRTVRYRYNPG